MADAWGPSWGDPGGTPTTPAPAGTFRLMAQLQHLFTQRATIEPWASQDSFGQSVYGTGIVYNARVEPISVRTGGENQVLMAGVKIYLKKASPYP